MTIDVTSGSTEIEVLPPARPAASEALGQLMAHAEAMSAAKQLGDALSMTDLVPKDYKGKPGNAAAAILYGAELGLNPIQSLQQIFVVHGSPAIYARTAVALVKRSGVLVETVSSANEAVTVKATDRRTGQVEQSTWDIPRATLAGYVTNAKYKTNPQEMLYAKAAMECCRKIAPDVLLGIPYSREELDLEDQPVKVRSERGGVGVKALRDRASAAQVVEAEAAPAPDPKPAAAKGDGPLTAAARKKWQAAMFAALADGNCKDKDDQLVVITLLSGRGIDDKPEHRDGISDDELRRVVGTLGEWKKDGDLADRITDLLGDYAAADDGGPADVMASQDQLDQLAQIRSAERYDGDDDGWHAHIQAASGVLVDADEQLTEEQAQAVIDVFNTDNDQ